MKISSSIFSLISIFILLLISSATSSDFDGFLQCLLQQSNSSLPIIDAILTPNNSTFQSIYQLRANNLRTFLSAISRPVAIITALHPSHAQAAVICAKRHDFQLRIRSGGHDFEGLSYTSKVPFVILDMFNLNSIDIDMSTETAWVQAGATTGELYYRIAEKSNVHGFPSGVWTTLGIGGHFSGGGYGFLMRKYELSIDNVIDAQLIDANGRILNRKSMGEDVFWAIRGGGITSFGIILSWRIKLVRVPPRVTVFTVQRTLEQGATELAYRWQQVAPKLPKDLFIRLQPVPINNGGNNNTSNSSLPIIDAILTPNNSTFQSIYQLRANNLRTFLSAISRPVAIITALHPSHAQAAVICAKRHDFQLRIRSGGHDFEGLSYTSKVPFVILDMFNLNSIDIDMSTETAWVQAGATTGELYYRIAEKSNVHGFPSGVWTTLGIGGHFSGGGYGFLMRKYELSIDNVIDAQLIDANGRILNRKSMGEDVFWAIRGGGITSFGIILSWRIKLVRVPPRVTVFTVQRTLEQGATELAYRWQQVAPKLPKDLFIRLQPVPINNGGNNNTVRVSFIGHFLGQADGLLRLMNVSFPELGLTRNHCLEMSWVESTVYCANFPNGTSIDMLLDRVQENKVFSKSKSDYYKALIPKQGLETLWQGLMDIEDILVQMNPYGGRMEEILDSETAFAHRAGNLFMVLYRVQWSESHGGINTTERYVEMSRRLYEAMAPYTSSNPREAFLNYRDLDIGSNESDETDFEDAQEYGAKYFRNNFIRLAKAKATIDPENFFKNEQSIPPLPH
ncbi:hypothetical protein GOBAR_AA38011 [Gossypium barbadense]|uniref:FAD-binding PCMH-type domain-containing protein n=1 Tax=Gossypium barbadense TaxID=3634 RepID=A0A2P5VV37_GOSBA|nr:hypothetical protein GOBAR_AA38011 [Gossypium barbadense]